MHGESLDLPLGKKYRLLAIKCLLIVLTLFGFLFSLNLMSAGFHLIGKETSEQIIAATSNPFIALFVGLLTTAVIQSSSTTTSMVVVMVASGTLDLEHAVPIVMGANIGTSITSTLVSLGHISKQKEFRKALAAATLHDFFNIIVAGILFPLEYFTGFISKISRILAALFYSGGGSQDYDIVISFFDPISAFVVRLFGGNPLLVLLLSVGLLFFSLYGITAILQKALIGDYRKKLEQVVFSSPLRSLSWGIGLTAAVQSSSVTTSLIVPLVATNKISIQSAFPFLMGANIGTTFTALLAAFSQTESALSIALAHLLFNVLGVLIVFPIPAFRSIPIWCAKKLGDATLENRMVGFIYILVTFFLIPFLFIFISEKMK